MFTLNSFYILVLLCSVCDKSKAVRKTDIIVSNICQKIYLELLVSTTPFNELFKLKVQWANAPAKYGDWIGIFKTDPKTGKVNLTPIEVIPVFLESNYMETDMNEMRVKPEALGYEGKCLNYYAGYFDKCHTCLAVNCLRIEPNWMWNLKSKIGPKMIRKVVIPGTYQSAWYRDNFKDVKKNYHLITQRERILGQLIYGTRYLQLRVSYQPDERHKFWATHIEQKLCPLMEIFRDIRSFLINTKEIVIVDFREFQIEFDLEVHRRFIHFLDLNLGDLAVPNSLNWDSTFNKIWYSGRRLIICYNLPKLKSSYLWKSALYKEAKGKNVDSLRNFFREVLKRPPKTAWAAIARVARDPNDPEYKNPFAPKLGSDDKNYLITSWYRNKLWLQNSNIVLVDFIKNKGIVKSAIEWNSGQCGEYF